jgi:hypothetical protein
MAEALGGEPAKFVCADTAAAMALAAYRRAVRRHWQLLCAASESHALTHALAFCTSCAWRRWARTLRAWA